MRNSVKRLISCSWIILLAVYAVCNAGLSHPLAIQVHNRFQGALFAEPGNVQRFMYLPRPPVWSNVGWAVQEIDDKGQVLHRGAKGFLIYASAITDSTIVIVGSEEGTLQLRILDFACKELVRSTIIPPKSIPVQLDVSIITTSNIFITISGTLYKWNSETHAVEVVEEQVLAAGSVLEAGSSEIAFMQDVGGIAYVTVVDTLGKRRVAPNVPLAKNSTIKSLGELIVIYSPQEDDEITMITFIDPVTSSSLHTTIPYKQQAFIIDVVPGTRFAPVTWMKSIIVTSIDFRNGQYSWLQFPLFQPDNILRSTQLPSDYGSLKGLFESEKKYYAVFAGGIVGISEKGLLQSSDTLNYHTTDANSYLRTVGNTTILSSTSTSVILDNNTQPLWWLFWFYEKALAFVVPIVLFIMLLTVWALYRKQVSVLDAMIEVPGAGMVLVIDAAGRLMRTNERAAEMLGITPNVPMRRMFRSYMLHAGIQELLQHILQVQASRAAKTDKVSIAVNGELREYVFSSVILRGTLGRYRGTVVTGVDITEALERRRLVNWAQLAHDMQTNLSTIRLNAEQLDDLGVQSNKERTRRILFQVGVLIQRVRDLVSVGRNDEITRVHVHSAELCTELRQEFDPAMFPHVHFSMKLRGTMMYVDRLKVSRAIRNAIENGIKALRGNEGTIELATWFDRSNVYIRVSDTGAGMDTDTLQNMMKPYFTTAKDGTGTGIGTMIMQHVVHLHSGSIRVNSEVGKGTQVIFRFPHLVDGAKQSLHPSELEGTQL